DWSVFSVCQTGGAVPAFEKKTQYRRTHEAYRRFFIGCRLVCPAPLFHSNERKPRPQRQTPENEASPEEKERGHFFPKKKISPAGEASSGGVI
ncbi:MAG: hypothetical protein D6714_00660, partial [Bacteroidetes bacterium]